MSTAEWAQKTYNDQYEKWVPWIEDMYLRWFTKDNKASYVAKDNLAKTKVTGVEQVDTLQDGVNNLVTGQVGQGGILEPVGNLASKEGLNRTERQGRDQNGDYAPSSIPGAGVANTAATSVADGGKAAAGMTTDGIKNAGGFVGGMFGGGQEKKQ